MKLHKKIHKILPVVEEMKAQLDNLREKIDKREEVFSDRSDKWQESDKGIEYEEKTQ